MNSFRLDAIFALPRVICAASARDCTAEQFRGAVEQMLMDRNLKITKEPGDIKQSWASYCETWEVESEV